MSHLSQALLIGRYPLTESSLIVCWSTAEHGLIRTAARAALKPKTAFHGRLDLFVSAEIRWAEAKRGDLHSLAEVQWSAARLGLRQSYDRVLAATYLVRLVEMLVEPEAPIPAVHQLLTQALDYLDTHEPRLALVERFELRLAEEMGLGGAPGRAVAALQSSVQKALPVQRRQLLARLKAS
jgi:DNA repair protein RecO (recombination protein O)